jgi:anion-transporting  ArsA/GET3 family ATPase
MAKVVHLPNNKKVEFFCGTGGVGKTTTAAARAVYLTKLNKKVLLITIDPAKRLKQVLGIENKEEGTIQNVSLKLFEDQNELSFDALLMTPYSTLKRVAEENNTSDKIDTNILKTLTKPYGGMNEIMSIVELQMQLKKHHYDTIILDTPPGKHFIDFLESSKKIQNFFDKTFVEIFQFLDKSFQTKSTKFFAPKNLITNLVSTGIKKLLSYLEDVTGESFVKELIDSVSVLYLNRQTFLDALQFHQQLKKVEFSNWFLVTSADQHKIDEAVELKKEAESFIHHDHFLIINKCLTQDFQDWSPQKIELIQLKESLLHREKLLKEFSSKNFENILEFHEVLSPSPQEHVASLSKEFH